MANHETFEYTTDTLWSEGRQIQLKLSRPTPTTVQLDWVYPADMKVTTGALLLLSVDQLNPSNYPTDSVKYTASTDFLAPGDTIGANAPAQVVGAFYDNILTTSVTITNVDPNVLYYATIHAASSIRQYHNVGIPSYPVDASRIERNSDSFTGDIPHSDVVPTNPTLGQVYFNSAANTVFMWTGSAWIPAGTGTPITGTTFPTSPAPAQGQFFYNDNTRELSVFNGTSWTHANTANVGTPMYNKIGVGTDGTYDERLRLISVLKMQLGYPAICVELNEDQFNMAIDNALDEFRRRADNAYRRQYVLFNLRNGQSMYYLNDPRIDTDKIVDVTKINRLQMFGQYSSNDSGVYAQVFLNQIFSPMPVDMLSIHLLANMSEEIERLFAGNLMFTWQESTREMRIQRKIYRDELVVLDCVIERTEQELLVDRWAKQWLQQWAEAECNAALGMIRSKFGSLPGAGGGITLNGSELLSRADAMFQDCIRQLADYEVGNGVEFPCPFYIA